MQSLEQAGATKMTVVRVGQTVNEPVFIWRKQLRSRVGHLGKRIGRAHAGKRIFVRKTAKQLAAQMLRQRVSLTHQAASAPPAAESAITASPPRQAARS